ncbi:ABC transporter substrate-binding protein [Microvirga sp. W0021]|uniref:ABC transporter substrate-binding protein n=1 Tax=Hohaiivirga grylli TaxID=3133970 RepID=A0ABV0BHE7_9HYPH
MKLIRNIVSGIAALPFVLGLSAAKAEEAPNLSGKKLVVYVAFHENEGKALLEAFKKKTGADFSFLRISAGEIVARVQAEKASPKADVILGGAAENHEFLKEAGLLEQYDSKAGADIPAYYKDKDHYWAGFYVGPMAIGINKQYWDKNFASKGLKMPETFEDLLNPAFKGEIVMPDAVTSGTGYTMIASIIQSMGEEMGMNYLKQLRGQIAQYTSSGFKPAQMVGSGEYLIALNFIHDQLLVAERGMPVVSFVPKGAGWEIGAVSVIKGGPNTDVGKAFADFMLTKEAGEIHSKMTQRLSTRSDVPTPAGAKPLDQMEINKDFSFAKASEQRKELVEKWKVLN